VNASFQKHESDIDVSFISMLFESPNISEISIFIVICERHCPLMTFIWIVYEDVSDMYHKLKSCARGVGRRTSSACRPGARVIRVCMNMNESMSHRIHRLGRGGEALTGPGGEAALDGEYLAKAELGERFRELLRRAAGLVE